MSALQPGQDDVASRRTHKISPIDKATDEGGEGTRGADAHVLFALVLLIQFRNKTHSVWEMGYCITKLLQES